VHMARSTLQILAHAITVFLIAMSLSGCFERSNQTNGNPEGTGAMSAALSRQFHGSTGEANGAGLPCETTTPAFMASSDTNSFYFDSKQDQMAKAAAATKAGTYYLAKAGSCPRLENNWGEHGDCLATSSTNFVTYTWHCPWESMILMSMADWGACSNVRIDCNQTKYNTILELYESHMTDANPPPEGNLQTVQYAHCCVKHQCQNGPICENAPWDVKKQQAAEAAARGSGEEPCGPEGCARLYSVATLKHLPLTARVSIAAAVAAAAAGAGLLAAMLVQRAARLQGTPYSNLALVPADVDLDQSERDNAQSDSEAFRNLM